MVASACDREVGKLLPQRACERKRRICATDQSCERRKPLGYQWVEDVCSRPLFRIPDLFCVRRWITNSYEAEVFLIFANTDFSKGYKGITCFVATKDMGIKVAKKEQKLGIRASSTCTLNFDDLKIPEENIIGGIGQGYKVAIELLNEGRIGIAGQMIGLAQGAFDKAVPYTYERKQFGQPIGHFQGMQFQIAQAAIEIEAARLLTYNAARIKEEGKNFVKEAAMAKFYASQVAQKVSGSAIEWAGGVGFTRETGIEKFWRDSKIVSHRVVPVVALLTSLSIKGRHL